MVFYQLYERQRKERDRPSRGRCGSPEHSGAAKKSSTGSREEQQHSGAEEKSSTAERRRRVARVQRQRVRRQRVLRPTAGPTDRRPEEHHQPPSLRPHTERAGAALLAARRPATNMGRKQPPVKSCQKCGRPLKGHKLPIGPSCGLEPDPHNLERNTEAKFRRRLALDHRRRQRPPHRDAYMDKNQRPVKICLKCGRPRKGHKLPIGPGCTLELDPHLLQKNQGRSSIVGDPGLPSHSLLSLLPSGAARQPDHHMFTLLQSLESSVTMATLRGEERGGAWLLPGLQCSVCAQPCSSHALLLAHTAAAHPIRLDGTAVGRLGNVMAYQETARLFHCSDCFFTCRDFSRLFTHLLTTHCSREEEEEEEEQEQEEQEQEEEEQEEEQEEEEQEEEEEQGGPPEEQGGPPEEQGGPPEVISYSQSRYVCVLCGWRTKLRGLALSHVVTVHRQEGRFSCSRCPSSFLLPAQLSRHLSLQHRPARYGCPYCPFTAHGLGGFRRHCQRCRGGGGAGGTGRRRSSRTVLRKERSRTSSAPLKR
ncbi:unnamed protein product [Boreogadus saida]